MRLVVAFGLVALCPAGLGAQAVAEVQVTPETMTLGVNQQQTIFAAAFDRQGNLIPSIKFAFWSSDTMIVQVLRDGTVVGVRPGLAKVEARARGRRASLAVLITGGGQVADDKPPPGAVLTLDPAALALLPGETARMIPQALRDDGSSVALSRLTWKSLKPEVATVDSNGVVVGVAPGRGIIHVTTTVGLMATAPVEVGQTEFVLSPVHLLLGLQGFDTLQLSVPAQGGRQLHAGIEWRSLDTMVARVDPTGIVHGEGPGRTEIVASGFGQERHVAVIVHKIPQAFAIAPEQREKIQVPRNGRRKFSAVAEAADSTPIPEVPVNWALRDTTTATFDPATGILIAKALGTTTLTARIPGFDPIVWTVEVIPGLLRLNRDRVGLLPGERATVDAMLFDDAGQSVGQISELRWTSDRPDVAAVDAQGNIRGGTPGRATVTATAAWGQSDTVVVFVVGDLLVTSNRGGRFGLYSVVSTKPDDFIPILADSAVNIQGVYAPDRTRIAFSSDRAGTYDLYVMDADGTNLRRITTDPGAEVEPAWLPDGTGLVYTKTPPQGVSQVYGVRLDGSAGRPLSAGPAASYSPAVSHNGRTVAFLSMRDANPDIYLVNVDGGTPQQVTDGSQRELLPRFLPNGDLLYAVERGRGKGARLVRRSPTARPTSQLFDTDQPLAALAISREGERIAYVVGKVIDPAKGRANFSLYFRPVASDGAPIAVSLRPNEQIAGVAF